MSLPVLLCWYSLVWCPGWWSGMLGTLFGKHNSDPIKVTASSLGSCEDKNQNIILYCQHYNASFTLCRRILKRTVSSLVGPTVHTNPSLKRSFRKTPFKPEKFEIIGFLFSFAQKILWTRSFWITMATGKSCYFLDRVFNKHKSNITGDLCVFNSCSVEWTKNTGCDFKMKPPFLHSSGAVRTGLQYCYKISCVLPKRKRNVLPPCFDW